jgi:ketosteroid isomerase-like protein
MDNANRETLLIGQRAFDAFSLAVETGDSRNLCDLMADDVRFFVPLPFEEWRGEQTGR